MTCLSPSPISQALTTRWGRGGGEVREGPILAGGTLEGQKVRGVGRVRGALVAEGLSSGWVALAPQRCLYPLPWTTA